MPRMVEISDIVRMVRECAPDTKLGVRNHSIRAKRAGRMTYFSKGPGTPRRPEDARGEEKRQVARKVATSLGLPRGCVDRHFPGLLGEDPAELNSALRPKSEG